MDPTGHPLLPQWTFGPAAPVNNMVNDEDRKFIAYQMKFDASTVTSENAICQAAAISVMGANFGDMNDSIAHLPESIVAMNKLLKLNVDRMIETNSRKK